MTCPPVIFIAFNRPDKTRLVFDEIRRAKPQQMQVVVDGPRNAHETDRDKRAEVLSIVHEIDWDCEVEYDVSDVNLGCKERVASGISNAFNRFDQAVILEDDCLPSQDFFRFTRAALDRYACDTRVMHVSGTCFPKPPTVYNNQASTCYLSKYPFSWGWGTWKRAWKFYDGEMRAWTNEESRRAITKMMDSDLELEKWSLRFQKALSGQVSAWDWPWQLSLWSQSGLTIVPKSNLVKNIGFDVDSTHTAGDESWQSIDTEPMGEIVFPNELLRDVFADMHQFKNFMCARVSPPDSPDTYSVGLRKMRRLFNMLRGR